MLHERLCLPAVIAMPAPFSPMRENYVPKDGCNGGTRVDRLFFFFQAEDGIRDYKVTGVQTCALPIYLLRGFLGFYFYVDSPSLSLRVWRKIPWPRNPRP